MNRTLCIGLHAVPRDRAEHERRLRVGRHGVYLVAWRRAYVLNWWLDP